MKPNTTPPSKLIRHFEELYPTLGDDLNPETLVRILKNILIRAATRSSMDSAGLFSSEKEYVVRQRGHLFYTEIPARAARYLDILLNPKVSPNYRIVEFYNALRMDDKVQHNLLRDELWDDTVAGMNKSLMDVKEDEVGSLNLALTAGTSHAITASHNVAKGVKGFFVGDRDVVDAYLKQLFDILSKPNADELKAQLRIMAKEYKVPLPSHKKTPMYDRIDSVCAP